MVTTRSQNKRKQAALTVEVIPYVMKPGDDDSVRHRRSGRSRRVLNELILYKHVFGQLPTEGDIGDFARRIKAHEREYEPGVRTRSQKAAIGERLNDGLRDKPTRRQRRLLHEVVCYIDQHGTVPVDGELGRFARRIGLNEDRFKEEEQSQEEQSQQPQEEQQTQELFDDDEPVPRRRANGWAYWLVAMLTAFSASTAAIPVVVASYTWATSPAGQDWFNSAGQFSASVAQNLNTTLTHWVNA